MLRTQGILLQSGEHGGFVKAVAQLPRRDGLCAVGGKIGKTSSALLDGHAVLQELPRKILDGERFVQRFPDNLAQLFFVGFKACRLGGLALCGKGGVFLIQRSLSLFPRPILTLGDTVCAAVQKVDLIKTGFVAQLHDLGFEIFHRRVGAAVLASGFRVGGSVHVGQQRHIFDPQTVDDDMHMDVAGLVMPVRVGADDRLMTGKLFPAKPLAKLLRLVHGQPVVRAVPWVKADDIVMALDILALLILAIAEVGAHTGNCKIFLAAVQGGNAVIPSRHKPPFCVQRGLHGKLVVRKGQVFFCIAVVGVFRADMFERCQRLHLPFPEPQTSRRRDWKPPPVPLPQAGDRDCASH